MSDQIEFDYYISPDGLVYSFHDNAGGPRAGRFLMSFTGQGMPNINYIQQRGPFQHGATVLDYRLSPRTITYLHRRKECDREGYWDIRADMLNMFRPNRQAANTFRPGHLRKVLPGGEVRDIDVYIAQGPVFEPRDTSQWAETSVNEVLRFYAPDPVFYDPTLVQLALNIDLCNLTFPFTFPFVFCGGALSESDSVTYPGTWLSYPTIRIVGPMAAGSIIRNLTTDEKLEFIRDVPAGRQWTISLQYGAKTITDDVGNNLIGALSTDSDLATFHIAPDPEAPGGVNALSASGFAGAAGITGFFLSYYTRYIGI